MTEEKKDERTDFELMNREDEDQIMSEMRGAPADKFVYKNKRGEYELNYSGTKWAVRKMANEGEAIRIEDHPKVERCPLDPEYIVVSVLGKRVKINREPHTEMLLDSTVGSARGWCKQNINGVAVPDEFFYTKTVSKAVRNVMQSLMPADFKKRVTEELGRMKEGKGTPRPSAPKTVAAPPPQSTTEAPRAGGQQLTGGISKTVTVKPESDIPPAFGTNAAAPAPAPAPAAAPAKPALGNIDVLRQRFFVVLKQVAKTTDTEVAQALLYQIAGTRNVSDLNDEDLKKVGNLLAGITNRTHEVRTGTILEKKTGAICWTFKGVEQAPPATPAPASAPAPAPVAPAAQDEDNLF